LNAAAPPDLPESAAPVFLSTNALPYNTTPSLPGAAQ
jgi:hypothetical protein